MLTLELLMLQYLGLAGFARGGLVPFWRCPFGVAMKLRIQQQLGVGPLAKVAASWSTLVPNRRSRWLGFLAAGTTLTTYLRYRQGTQTGQTGHGAYRTHRQSEHHSRDSSTCATRGRQTGTGTGVGMRCLLCRPEDPLPCITPSILF